MDVLEKEESKACTVTVKDFPFICRICCMRRSDMRPFEEEDYLSKLFHTITKIDVGSTLNFPRNVCSHCINAIEDISTFTEVSKYYDSLQRTSKKINPQKTFGNGTISFWEPLICRACSSASSLVPFEEDEPLVQLFHTITKIDVQLKTDIAMKICLCSTCIDSLEDISTFISSSRSNNEKLEEIIGIPNSLKSLSNGTDIEVKLERDDNRNEEFISDMKHDIEIKEEVIDSEFAATISRDYQTGLKSESPYEDITNEHSVDNINTVDTDDFPLSAQSIKENPKPKTEKVFECFNCKKTYADKKSLKMHMVTHSLRNAFKCDECGKFYKRKQILQRHLLTHVEGKPFRCDQCGKCYAQMDYLKRHLTTHNKSRPFKCDKCYKDFTQNNHLKEHYLLTHTSNIKGRIFECYHCGKRFYQKSALNRHSLTHTGEMLFRCERCDESFTKSGFEKHLEYHKEEDVWNFQECRPLNQRVYSDI
ncbi:uncharacterized protein isoform X1 [Leptinotarsa decemlineata]|uniref:uncharacterized protein isoform X1 n=1 Tax=Leptinotarsa decemlineata TaxID=7539 RepID=UPI003D306951